MTPVLLSCARNAHDQTGRVRRPQWDQHGCHSQRGEASKLKGITIGSVRSTSALANEPDKLDQPDRPAQRLARPACLQPRASGSSDMRSGRPSSPPSREKGGKLWTLWREKTPGPPFVRDNRLRLHRTLGHVSPGPFEPQNLVPIRGGTESGVAHPGPYSLFDQAFLPGELDVYREEQRLAGASNRRRMPQT